MIGARATAIWVLSAALMLAGCVEEAASPRPALFDAAPSDVRGAIERADRHILVVRHARKIAEDCNALDCPLSEHGRQMVFRLAGLLGEPVTQVYASNACRAVETAAAAGGPVIQHQAGTGHTDRCGGGAPVERTRTQAMEEARFGAADWTLVAEHSNTVCLWVEAFATGAEPLCEDGALPADRYGDVFWLYRADGRWSLTRLDAAFDVPSAAL